MLVRAAHPRSRGENLGTPSPRHPLYGSSPLTRGKLPGGGYPETLVGLIPAHAGKTGHQPPPPGRHSAHPRSRGENELRELIGFSDQGSSPLTRGKPHLHRGPGHPGRLIPAHAGKTPHSHAAALRPAAHPRSRGENCCASLSNEPPTGSSPLTRGKPPEASSPKSHAGLIPAHAGKTRLPSSTRRVPRAHPRSRGENARSVTRSLPGFGSSPLTRGKLLYGPHRAQ